jgi:hypothetical protein
MVTFIDPGPKTKDQEGIDRLIVKGEARGGLENVSDVVRGTFIVDHPQEADAIIQELAKHFEVVAEGWKLTNLNYGDKTVNVRMPNGMVGEILIMDADMAYAKSKEGGGHALYIEGLGLARAVKADPGNAELKARLDDVYERSQKLYGKVLENYSPEWRAAFDLD